MNLNSRDIHQDSVSEFSPQNFSFPSEHEVATSGSEEPESNRENPYQAAGYETGDIVEYRHKDGHTEIYTVDMGEHGAWLIKHGPKAYEKGFETESTHPDKCTPYQYTTTERALESYQNLLSSPAINSKQKLFSLFDAMHRSGVTPIQVGLRSYGDNMAGWGRIKEIIEGVAGGMSDNYITRDFGLRDKVNELLKTQGKSGKEIFDRAKIPADQLKRWSDELAELNKSREKGDAESAEKIKLLLQIKIGDKVLLKNKMYRKISEDLYASEMDAKNDMATIQQDSKNAQQMLDMVRSPYLDLEEIKVIKAVERGLSIVMESPAMRQQANEQFKRILGDVFPLYFPNRGKVIRHIEKSEIKQGGFGDCYLLAAINSVKKTNPTLYYETLARTITKTQNTGEWKVVFQGHRDIEIRITEKDLQQWGQSGAKADKADIILERAYTSLKSRLEKGEVGRSMELNFKGDLAFEGGFGHRALNDILGSEVAAKYKIADYQGDGDRSLAENGHAQTAKAFFENLYAKNPERYIITANSPHTKNGRGQNDRRYEMINGVKMHYKHAYSVVGYRDGQIHIENPHDTGKDFWMSMDSFLKFFAQLSYVEVRAKYQE